jgi:hypothetical protein
MWQKPATKRKAADGAKAAPTNGVKRVSLGIEFMLKAIP